MSPPPAAYAWLTAKPSFGYGPRLRLDRKIIRWAGALLSSRLGLRRRVAAGPFPGGLSAVGLSAVGYGQANLPPTSVLGRL